MHFGVDRLFELILDTCPAKDKIYFAGSENQSKKIFVCALCVSAVK
jgi:hypothetical protein